MSRIGAAAIATLLLASCASLPPPAQLPSGARYVAMGSSFASGPGVTVAADARDPRCSRSKDNYAQQVARALQLSLVDMSCSGATTKHVHEGWNELPAQVAALSEDTALVTVTIGGNDVGYVGRLFAGSCGGAKSDIDAVKTACEGMRARAAAGGDSMPSKPDEASWKAAEAGLEAIAAEVRRRAPKARLIFVEYLTIAPEGAPCATMPLSVESAKIARETAARLAKLTQTVAQRSGAEALPMAKLSRGHDACAVKPWVTGFVPAQAMSGFVPYHPNLEGMTAVADALVRAVR